MYESPGIEIINCLRKTNINTFAMIKVLCICKDVSVFMEISGNDEWSGDPDAVPLQVLIPAYVVSELRTAFIIGFLIYIPFLVIDMVVSSVLMSMGMMMLPPTTISMPFKILLFVLADGWNLIIVNLVKTFY